MEPVIGFSTGVIYRSGLSLKERLRLFRELGCTVVELNFVNFTDLFSPDTKALTAQDLEEFSYVSLHAPVRDILYEEIVLPCEVLNEIARLNNLRSLDWVIFHPDTVADFSIFQNLTLANASRALHVAFENMDRRKRWGKTVGYMEELLARNPNWGFVFDVNHAYTNDPSGELARDILKVLGHRMVQVHLSGFTQYHEPLHVTRQADIIRSIADVSCPIIIESVLTPETLSRELEFIQKHI